MKMSLNRIIPTGLYIVLFLIYNAQCEPDFTAIGVISDFIDQFTGQWNTWMLMESSEVPTLLGKPDCCIWNYSKVNCSTLTVAFNRYEDTYSLYMQTFGYSPSGGGTLHIQYISVLDCNYGMLFENQFEHAYFRYENGDVEEISINADEDYWDTGLNMQYSDFLVLYFSKSEGLLIIANDENHSIVVLLSEERYIQGGYEEYWSIITTVLTERSIDYSTLVEIELHALY